MGQGQDGTSAKQSGVDKPKGGKVDKGKVDKPAGGKVDKPKGGKVDKPAGGKVDKPQGRGKKPISPYFKLVFMSALALTILSGAGMLILSLVGADTDATRAAIGHFSDIF